MIRFIATVTTIIGFLILSIPLLIVLWIVNKFNSNLCDTISLSVVKSVFRAILKISGVTVTVLGEDRVPQDTSVLYVVNHRSLFDILLTYVRVPRPTGYVSKVEMIKLPLLSNWMKNLHCLFLDRNNIREGLKTILLGIEKIKSGISICIFPEGTRNKSSEDILTFHNGSFKMAEKGKCPIVPIVINNASSMLEDQFPRIKKTHVIVEYCQPINIEALNIEDRKFLGSYVHKLMLETYRKNKETYFS